MSQSPMMKERKREFILSDNKSIFPRDFFNLKELKRNIKTSEEVKRCSVKERNIMNSKKNRLLSGCTPIIEEDEEKMKTLYDSKKKFYNHLVKNKPNTSRTLLYPINNKRYLKNDNFESLIPSISYLNALYKERNKQQIEAKSILDYKQAAFNNQC